MTSMPVLRLCALIVPGYVAIVQVGVNLPVPALNLAGLVVLALSTTLAFRKQWSGVRALCCLTIALLLASRCISLYVPAGTHFDIEQSARIDGYVTRAYSVRGRVMRCVVEGELDERRLPATHTRVLLTIFRDSTTSASPTSESAISASSTSEISRGCRVIVVGRVRRPDKANIPAEFDEQAMCRSQQISFVATANVRDVEVVERQDDSHIIIESVQRGISDALHSHVADDIAAVLAAIIIGDESKLSYEARSAYAQSGTAHMFSVSGSHVSILLALGLAITVFIRRKWLRGALLFTLIVCYVIVSGGSAPAWRAAIMGLLALWGRNTERDVQGLNVMAAAILCMLIHDPLLPWSAGFQLSVAATAAILILTPRWNSLLKRCTLHDSAPKRYLRVSCAVTLAASAGISLPSALIFNQVAVWSPVANFFVVPLLSLSMVAGSGLVIVHYLAPWLAPSLAWCCTTMVQGADAIVWFFARLQPPSATTAHAVGEAILTLGLCVWPLVATSWTGLLARQLACVTMITCVVLTPTPHPETISMYTRRSGRLVVLRTKHRTVALTILRKRDIAVERYIKSLHKSVKVVELH